MSGTLDTILVDAEKAAPYIEPILAALAIVVASTGIGGPAAVEAVALIRAAVRSLEHAANGTATVEEATARIKALGDSIVADNAAADAALTARFPRP
jgi:ribose 5-phosphate isomerase RpiB